MSLSKSQRARGATRGGCGGGYERTSDSYDSDKLRRLRAEYDAMAEQWRPIFLDGLSRYERLVVENRTIEIQ